MFGKWMAASVASLGLMTPMAVTSKAEASSNFRIELRSGSGYGSYGYGNGYGGGFGYNRGNTWSAGHRSYYGGHNTYRAPVPVVRPVVENHYHVMYRHCDADPWRQYGTYDCHELAHEIEHKLQARGFLAKVVHH